jgi:dTDP-4-amino-4,6-dideoxygalactose transaminase
MADTPIRLSRSVVGAEEQKAVAEVLAEGYLGMGRFTQAFEVELTDHLGGGRQVVCVNTGTAALQLALQGLGIGPGDEVIAPSLTFVASFQAISATGARAIACDVDPRTGFMDVDDAARRITARTKAIMPVHYASVAPELEAVYELAKRAGLRVVEDAAHAFGGERRGARVGSIGDVVCFSFDGIKNITCGEGGAVVTSDAALAANVRDARLLGVEKDTEKRYAGARSWDFECHAQGWRYHMSNIMAAIGRAQLKRLPEFSAHRRAALRRYLDAFEACAGLEALAVDWDGVVPHIFVVRILGGRRDSLIAHLRGKGIESGFHYKPNHLLARYRTDYRLPGADRIGSELVTLPLHAAITVAEQDRVVREVRAFLERRTDA